MNHPAPTHTPIYISRDDFAKLRLLVTTALYSNAHASLQKLKGELDRAVVLDPAALPADIVTMGSTVQYEDLGANEVEEYTISFPDGADAERRRISILAPIGTALIGCRVGDIVNWSTPGGLRKLKVRRVTQPEGAAMSPAPEVVGAAT